MREVRPITIKPSAVAMGLGVVVAVVLLLHLLASVSVLLTGHPLAQGLFALFSLDVPGSASNFFGLFLLLSAALLLAGFAVLKRREEDPDAGRWALLAFVFLLLTLDEHGAYHARVSGPLRAFLEGENLGFLSWAFVLVGVLLVLAFVVLYLRFLKRLPRKTRWTFVLAAALIVGGAVVVKMVGGYYLRRHGWVDMDHALITTVEEGLEMAGAVVFIHGLLEHIGESYGEVQLRIRGSGQERR